MKLLPVPIIIAVAALVSLFQDPTQRSPQSKSPAPTEVEQELSEVAKDYKEGKFAEAQQHAERAVLLDPANRTAAIYLARVTHQRYKPGVDTPENLEFAQSAIAAYQRVLTLDPLNEEPYKAVAVLYASTHQDELLKEWIRQRALDPRFSNEKRAEAYAVLAGKYRDCSFKFTERPPQKHTEIQRGKATVTYRMPADRTDFERAKQCVTTGLDLVAMALELDHDSESAWSNKTNLLLEAAKLAQMEGMDPAKANYEKEAKEASIQAGKMTEKRRRAEESAESEPSPSPSPSPDAPRQMLNE